MFGAQKVLRVTAEGRTALGTARGTTDRNMARDEEYSPRQQTAICTAG